MSADGIYQKTEKGRSEIVTRANRLGLRERAVLIMVDDKTSHSGLLAKNTHPSTGTIIDTLLAQGFIELAGANVNVTASNAQSAPKAAPPIATAAPLASAGEAPVEISMQSASRFACQTLLTYLGPGADDLTALVEKCKTIEELTARLEKCRDVLQGVAGKKKSDDFWTGVSARLPAA